MRPGSEPRRIEASRLALAVVVLMVAACGPAPSPRLDPAHNRLPMDAWVSVVPDENGGVRPIVRVSAPHRSLVFRRDEDRFHSGLEARVTAWRDGQQVGGGVSEIRVAVNGYEATRGDSQLELVVPLMVRGDEPVSLDVAIRVVESSRAWARELSFTPRALRALPIWIASVRAETSAAPGEDLIIEAGVDSLRLAVVLQRRSEAGPWPESGLSLVSEATASVQGELVLLRWTVPDDLAPGEARQVDAPWPADRLPFGRCRLLVLLELSRDTEWIRLPHEPPLEVVNLRVPLTDDKAWRRHLDWLEDALSDSRRDSLRDVGDAARPEAWSAIWQDLGTIQGLPPEAAQRRHLLRIVNADDRFGAHDRGARSDRGRTLIRWGEPASIESYADARAVAAVWEVWEYPQRDRRLFFYDAHGTGDFRLRRDEPLDP